MLKKPYLILACIIVGFMGTSQGFSLVDFVTKLLSSHDLTADSNSSPDSPLNLCQNTQCTLGSGGVFGNVPEVNEFIDTYLEAVYKSDGLKNAFNLSGASPKKNAELVQQYTDNVLCEIGVDPQSAAATAKFAAEAIPQLDSLTMPTVSKAYANMAANFFYVTKALKPNNAKALAMFLAKSMEDRAKTIKSDDDATSKFLALANGFVGAFAKKGLFTPDKAPILGFYVGNQWELVAADPCTNKKFV